MRTTTDGLIIKEQPVGESDRLVSVLTREHGLIRAFVRGARRIRNKNASATALLCYSHLTLFHAKDTYTIDEASGIEVFFALRQNIETLALAQYICELSLCFSPVEAPAEDYLRLTLNALALLADGQRKPALVKAIFELRLLALAGYMPDLVACKGCAAYEAERMYFDVGQGVVYCENCRRTGQAGLLEIGRAAISALRHIIYADFNKIFSFEISDSSLRQLAAVTERYLLERAERRFGTLDFYHSLGL